MTTETYRGWSIDLTPAGWMATSPNYDASYEGPEDGWVDNGEKVTAATVEDLRAEIDAWIDAAEEAERAEERANHDADATAPSEGGAK